ncbi:hypothetical protein C0Q70_04247 [Pomacea canaliculata]|uniref:Methionine--tRNA ligase, cytoplasmic n=1 Tax=Pomacea canaliculata TaxID=400727 RepID=A0A2T7PV08_POMCA|nr:hypothetical protein C0Q70_04247 [Pomacea canaliculata]
MKLYTDFGNFQTLKVLSAVKIAGIAIEKTDVDHGAQVVPYLKKSRLPVLEVSPNKFLFSANSIVSYLFSSQQQQTLGDEEQQWLEWESVVLQPVALPYLTSALGHEKPEKDLLKSFPPLLQELDNGLRDRQYLVGEKPSAADVVLFGTVFPLLQDKLFNDILHQFPAVRTWINTIQSQKAVQEAINEVTRGTGAKAFKQSLLTQPVPSVPVSAVANVPVPISKKQTTNANNIPQFSASDVPEVEKVSAHEAEAAFTAWAADSKHFPCPLPRKHPILPVDGGRNILITSALPYVNNVPHLGNIIGCVLSADAFSRFCRLRNYNVLYICGTDEYGTATETKALEEGLTPQEICDKYNKLHTEIYQWFNIDFDYFGRTTTVQQTEIAQDIFWRLHERGFILSDSIEQLHCSHCDKFLADRYVEGTCPLCGFDDARGDQCDGCGRLINATELKNPRCKLCQKKPSPRVSQHLFLDLPQLEPQLKSHLDKVFSSGTWTTNSRTITSSWIRDGLKPRCISRDLKWGTPVPLEGYTDKVFYVWFDAPIGYLSITANYTDHWKKWWKNPEKVELYNFLGKDNVPFHSVIFPSCLLGADDNYTVVNHMVATEYLNYEDTKFSKSRGTGVFGDQAKDTGIPADIYRFYLLYVRPESQDSSFSWDDLLLKNNSELLNNLGNFINRALMFLSNNFGGVVQEMIIEDEDKQLLALINRELATYITNMDHGRLRDGIRNILTISRLGNQYMQSNKPWVHVKGSAEEKKRAGTVVSLSANVASLLSVLLIPYMPDTSATIQKQLNYPPDAIIISDTFLCRLPPGHALGKPSPLFQKIEASTIAELKTKFAGKPSPPNPATPSAKGDAKSASDPAEVSRLTQEVSNQGNRVREMKAAKADKKDIETEVAKLLELKRILALAQGDDTSSSATGVSKKKGKKK